MVAPQRSHFSTFFFIDRSTPVGVGARSLRGFAAFGLTHCSHSEFRNSMTRAGIEPAAYGLKVGTSQGQDGRRRHQTTQHHAVRGAERPPVVHLGPSRYVLSGYTLVTASRIHVPH